jgi:hypothetical protein
MHGAHLRHSHIEEIMKFKIKARVSLPAFKLERDRAYYYKVMSEMYVGEKISDDKGAPTFLQVSDLETGEAGVLFVTHVMQKEFKHHYVEKNLMLTGRCFEIKLTAAPEGKRYHVVTLNEIEVEDAQAADASAPIDLPSTNVPYSIGPAKKRSI